ncbi:MAG: BrnA antitoxin family protein [Treponema sp.]|jgi:uncharacterized protein (DUF4415 family)|nr:BrnA antitoxin family protein [Treponema sp.]
MNYPGLQGGRHTRAFQPAVTIRVMPECLAIYKAPGEGYAGVMADVLKYVVDNLAF